MRFSPQIWLMGIVATLFVGGSLAWATTVSADTRSVREKLATMETKFATMETKLDRLMQDMQELKNELHGRK